VILYVGFSSVIPQLARSAFLVTYTDAGVRYTKTERNNRKTAQRMVMTFPCPIRINDSSMAEEVSRTPPLFKGIWFHTTEVKSEISLNGWNPQRIKNSIYGTAIYLAHDQWDIEDLWSVSSGRTNPVGADILRNGLRDPNMFVCVLALQANEVQSCFPTERIPNGNTGDHLLEYLNMNVPVDTSGPRGLRRINVDNQSTSVRFSRNPGLGNNRQNKKIAEYFLNKGIKAIKFLEHDREVVAVFDPNWIRVIPEDTNFDVHPFPDILAADPV
jgi:hypothetical protein